MSGQLKLKQKAGTQWEPSGQHPSQEPAAGVVATGDHWHPFPWVNLPCQCHSGTQNLPEAEINIIWHTKCLRIWIWHLNWVHTAILGVNVLHGVREDRDECGCQYDGGGSCDFAHFVSHDSSEVYATGVMQLLVNCDDLFALAHICDGKLYCFRTRLLVNRCAIGLFNAQMPRGVIFRTALSKKHYVFPMICSTFSTTSPGFVSSLIATLKQFASSSPAGS